MARKGEYERFVERGAGTFMRAAQAQEFYTKLFGVRPQLYVQGTFNTKYGEVEFDHWVPVDATSTGFLQRGAELEVWVAANRRYDFMLDKGGRK